VNGREEQSPRRHTHARTHALRPRGHGQPLLFADLVGPHTARAAVEKVVQQAEGAPQLGVVRDGEVAAREVSTQVEVGAQVVHTHLASCIGMRPIMAAARPSTAAAAKATTMFDVAY
jgi:hypothetical protein